MTSKDNYCVIMGGGIGSRFWPFSRKTPSKTIPWISLARGVLCCNKPSTAYSKVIPTRKYIHCNQRNVFGSCTRATSGTESGSQILLEPARRNTAPCIAWAAYHIRALNPNANIVVAPSDHLILKEGEFLEAILKRDLILFHTLRQTTHIRH